MSLSVRLPVILVIYVKPDEHIIKLFLLTILFSCTKHRGETPAVYHALTDHVPDLQILKQIYDDVSNDTYRPIMKHK